LAYNLIRVEDPKQAGYSYKLEAPQGRDFDPEFTPDLTPAQMLKLGVFDGNYFDGFHEEYPKAWFKGARLSSPGDPNVNFFQVHASQPLEVWEEKGWIYENDPRGWFQWYCRYYMGRRIPVEDRRQIKRWKAIRRHEGQLRKYCKPGDMTCRRRQRQALLHWAYDSRKI